MITTRIIVFCLSGLLLWGCSSERDTAISRKYHTMVSFFNGFYHAELRYKESVREMERELIVPETGYISLLALTESAASATAGQGGGTGARGGGGGGNFGMLDIASKKCDLIIFRHKNGNYVDDCYLLKGKCAYQKANYYEAIVNFEHLKRKFPDSELLPAANMWTAKSHLMAQNPYRAKESLKKIRQQSLLLDKKLQAEITELEVTLQIQNEQINEALVNLERHVDIVKGRRRKARWRYLMGQLYTERNAYTKAIEAYQTVVKLNASNEINFKAKLNIIELHLQHQPNGQASTEHVNKMLRKMARDGKYREYRDQIFYLYAQMELKKPDYDKAQKYLRKSLDNSGSNKMQQADSYFAYAEISFHQKQELKVAQAYYDSAAAVVPENHPSFDLMKNLAATLKSYIEYKENIHVQDSLLLLAQLPERELIRFIDEQIDREEAEKEKQRIALEQKKRDEEMARLNDLSLAGNSEIKVGGFKFDDPNHVAKAKGQFRQIWGDRKDEDHWRRSNKKSVAGPGGSTEEQIEALAASTEEELEERKKEYLANVPRKPEQKAVADSIVMHSLYGLAVLFDQKLYMPDSAAVYYDELLSRYPKSEMAAVAHYSLYILYKEAQDPRSEKHKKVVLDDHPKSLYAKLIKRAGALSDDQDENYDFLQSYKNLYYLYEGGDFETVVQIAEFMIANMLDHPNINQVYYLQGLAKGKKGDTEGLKASFQFLVQNYPDSETASIAKRTLAFMGVSGYQIMEEQATKDVPGADPAFKGFNPRKGAEAISVVMFVEESKVKSKELEVLMSNFGNKHFSTEGYRAIVFSYSNKEKEKYHMIYVTKFQDYGTANTYLQKALGHKEVTKHMEEPTKQMAFITNGNFKVAFSQKRFEDYAKYYEKFRDDMLRGTHK